MALGNMNKPISIYQINRSTDEAGFSIETEVLLSNVRAYIEEKHASEHWSNLSCFSEATHLFRIRVIPGVSVTPINYLTLNNERYDILSVENIKGKNLYIEIIARKVNSSNG